MDTPEKRIADALSVIIRYGGIDGSHHKDWVLDQAVRCLTGCPEVELTKHNGTETYTYTALGESEEYKKLVSDACAGEDGPETYSWEVGVAP